MSWGHLVHPILPCTIPARSSCVWHEVLKVALLLTLLVNWHGACLPWAFWYTEITEIRRFWSACRSNLLKMQKELCEYYTSSTRESHQSSASIRLFPTAPAVITTGHTVDQGVTNSVRHLVFSVTRIFQHLPISAQFSISAQSNLAPFESMAPESDRATLPALSSSLLRHTEQFFTLRPA